MRDHMRTELTTAALMMADQRQRPAPGLVCHSDRGSQYAAETYRKQLAGMKAVPSMSRTACCYDNAPMESFFHTMKVELVHQRRWATRYEARRDLFAYIGSASIRHSAISPPSRPRGKRANPVSVKRGQDQRRSPRKSRSPLRPRRRRLDRTVLRP